MRPSLTELLAKPNLSKAVPKEFEECPAGRKYTSPMPDDVKQPLKIAQEAAKVAWENCKHIINWRRT